MKKYNIKTIEELQVIDNLFYINKTFINKKTKEKIYKFVYEPRAQLIGLGDKYKDFGFFSVKVDNKWTITEITTGCEVYQSKVTESKLNAINSTLKLLNEKFKNSDSFWFYLNNKLNLVGLSPRFR